jgi:hypothetical protein
MFCVFFIFVFFRTQAKHCDKIVSDLDSQARTKEYLIFSTERSKALAKQALFLLISIPTTTTLNEGGNRTHGPLLMSKENWRKAIWRKLIS